MPQVKMPTGEIVDMPDNPTPEQLDALSQIMAQHGTNSPKGASNPAPAGGGNTGSISRANPKPPSSQAAPHTPWGPTGSTLRAIQNFLATPEGGFASPTANNLARGVGLAAGTLGKGVTGTAGLVADAAAALAGQHDNLPSQQFANLFPKPQGFAENAVDLAGQMAVGSKFDPLAKLATQGMAQAAPQARAPTPREMTIQDARKAGYVVPPSQGRAGLGGRLLEGVAGSDQLAQEAARRNQLVTDTLAKRAAGLPEDAHLNEHTLKAAIDSTYKAGYGPLEGAGQMTNGRIYRKALDKVVNDFQGASGSFPGASHDDVRQLVDAYRVPTYDAKDAVDAIKSLRESATDSFARGNSQLAHAQRGVASALENSIELNLNARGQSGQDMLQAFRDARTQLAKQYVVQGAIKEGTGDVNALKIASALQRGKPLTDELRTIGQFANTAGKSAAMPTQQGFTPNAIGPLAGLAGMLGGMPAAAAVGGAPMARWGLRSAILSGAGQRALVDPKLAPSLMQQALADPRLIRGMPALATGLYDQ